MLFNRWSSVCKDFKFEKYGNRDSKAKTLSNWKTQLWYFINVMKPGDLVALPLKSRPTIAIGRVTGSYSYRKDLPPDARHTRPVEWKDEYPRSSFDQDLRYSLGAFLTVCRIQRNHAEDRVIALIANKPVPPPTLTDISIDTEADLDLELVARDKVRERIAAIYKGHELTKLVAEILQAQGYQVRVSPEGPDGGIDIIAGRGPLGFEPPRLAVQVKSGDGPVDVKILRELQGVMKNFGADQGLLVSWGGFKSSVLKESARLFFEIRLWDSDELIKMIQTHYEQLSDDIQAGLPLKRIWTLVLSEE